MVHAGASGQLRGTASGVSPGQSASLPAMQPAASSFNRSPANSTFLPASAPAPAPQEWLKQSEALSSLSSLSMQGPVSDVASQGRELYKVDLQVRP